MGVTIYHIAEKAHVSIATVSRVLNNHPRVSDRTRRRVMEVAGALGYQPHAFAQSLARRKAHLVAAVIPMLTNYFFVEILRGIQDRLMESEFDLLVLSVNTLEQVEGQLDRAVQKGTAAGVLVFATPLSSTSVERLKQSGQPVVLVDAFHEDFDSISVNSELGGYTATRHLLDLGYRRIGLIMGHPASVPSQQRQAGYERALREAGLDVDRTQMVFAREEHHHGFTEEAGYSAMLRLLERRPRPEAVFAGSDMQALGAMRAVQEGGLSIPGDIAVLGFDDIKISHYVGLSTLRQPMYEMGRLAVEKLLARIVTPDHPTAHTVFSPALVCRQTCGDAERHANIESNGTIRGSHA